MNYSDNNMKWFPVLFATDENYAMQTFVALTSLIQNNTNNPLDVYVLIPKRFPDPVASQYELLTQHNSVKINFVEMGTAFSDIEMRIPHITSPTYYRLLAAEILPQYSKCLYLDSDVIVKEDLAELFSFDLDDHYVAGVKAPAYIVKNDISDRHCRELGIPSSDQYINCGVLLMNLDVIRRNKLTESFVALSRNAYSSQDQDVINAACYDHIFHLPFRYNVMTKYLNTTEKAVRVFGEHAVDSAIAHPYIIHYADRIKPWTDVDIPFAFDWWSYALKTPYAKQQWEILAHNYAVVKESLNEKSKTISLLEKEIRGIHASRSYRIGRFITFPLRKVREYRQRLKPNRKKPGVH